MDFKVGDKIRIVHLDDPYSHLYEGKEGVITYVGLDSWDKECIKGTWSGIKIYPEVDEVEIIG